jgi:SNF2 family DNA or RNA helicase
MSDALKARTIQHAQNTMPVVVDGSVDSFPYNVTDDMDPPQAYQLEEIEHIVQQTLTGKYTKALSEVEFEHTPGGSANWDDMGCKKTTTGLWCIQRIVAETEIENPAVLVITTRAGKGTFYQWAPRILPEFTVLDIGSQSISVVQDGKVIKLPPGKLKYVPAEFNFPCIVLAHYQIFSRSTHGQFVLDDDGNPKRDEDGAAIMEPPTQGDYVAKRKWDFCWLDESHKIKDKDAKWTKGIDRIKSTYRHVSTGTGYINRPSEIWKPLNWLDEKAFASYWTFHDLFCDFDESDGYSREIGVKPEMKDAFRKLVRAYGPRKTIDEVMPHIKKPIFVDREVELNETQRKMYDDIKSQLYALDKKGTPIHAANVLTLLQRLRAICVATPEVVEDYYDEELERRVQRIKLVEPSSKLDDLQNLIEELSWDNEYKAPVVVFSNFVGPLELLQTRFENANKACEDMHIEPEFPYIWLKASDNDETRYRKWHDLFPTMEYKVFMATVQLGGESINLTPARHVVFLDRSWSPKDNSQGIGRIRRPGQEGQPVVININAKDTVDKYIEEVNNIKQGWFHTIFGDE